MNYAMYLVAIVWAISFASVASAAELRMTCNATEICQEGNCLQGESAQTSVGNVAIAIPLTTPDSLSVTIGSLELAFERLGTSGAYIQEGDKNYLFTMEFADVGGSFMLQKLGFTGSDWLSDSGLASTRVSGMCIETDSGQ